MLVELLRAAAIRGEALRAEALHNPTPSIVPAIEFAQTTPQDRPREGPALQHSLQPLDRFWLQQAKPDPHSPSARRPPAVLSCEQALAKGGWRTSALISEPSSCLRASLTRSRRLTVHQCVGQSAERPGTRYCRSAPLPRSFTKVVSVGRPVVPCRRIEIGSALPDKRVNFSVHSRLVGRGTIKEGPVHLTCRRRPRRRFPVVCHQENSAVNDVVANDAFP